MRYYLVAGLLLACGLRAHAGLDPEVNSPYQLRVVMRIGDHPHFTAHFRREIKIELQRQLQAALGTLGSAEVVDQLALPKEEWPPLWKLVEEKGLEALDNVNDVGGGKTHFLRIEFSEGGYELQARQHDGTSGFATPIIRKSRTHDRNYVAREAALMVGLDFGLVATLNPAGAGDKFFITAKASAKGPIDHWVKKGEVFAVVAIRTERRRVTPAPNSKSPSKTIAVQTGNRLDGVLLQVTDEPRDGVIPCRVFNRYEPAFPAGVASFRCVKLGTITGVLRLRLVDPAGAPQKAAALQVYARSGSFPDGDREADQAANRDGVFVSKMPIANIAFVRVLLGKVQVARIPIEMLDNRVEVRSIRLEPAAEARDRLDAERRGLLTRLTDDRLIQVRCFQEITALEQAGKKADALERGETTFRLLESSTKDVGEEVENLKARAAKVLPKAELYANDCAQQVQILQARQKELTQHLESLRQSIAEDNDPKVQAKKRNLQNIVRDAELLAEQAEYDKALAKYEEAIAAAADEPAAKQRIDVPYQALKKAWRMKGANAAHTKARSFIFETWPKLGALADIRDQLPAARQAFEACKAAHDRLAVNKMHLAAIGVATRFGDELKKLTDSAMDEEELKTLATYQKVNDDLRKLLGDIEIYLLSEQKK